MKIIITHQMYGCDTGCCGHVIGDKETGKYRFEFDHPCNQDYFEWAKKWVAEEFGEDHVKDLDFENCVILDD